MEYNFVFFNPLCIRRGAHYGVPSPTYVGEFLRSTLVANGIRNYHVDMEAPIVSRTLTGAIGEMCLRVWRLLRSDCQNIVGVTNWTTNAWLARAMMRALQVQCREAHIPLLVVAGGPFFAKEQLFQNGSPFPDSVEASLANSGDGDGPAPYDVVVYGGFQALVDLMQAVAGDAVQFADAKIVPLLPPAGYYFRRDGRVTGSGCARNAAIALPPVVRVPHARVFDCMIMFSNNCANRCDYCSTGQNYRFDADQIRQAIKDFRITLAHQCSGDAVHRMRYLKLLDPNAFATHSRAHTNVCLDVVRSELGFAPAVHCFYDSYAFREPEAVLAEIREQHLRRLAVGREAVCEPCLSFIGRRYLGRLRNCEMLEEERAGLIEVIRKQKENRRTLEILLDYIISPADTWESLEAAFRDMRHFAGMSDDTVRVKVHWEPLWPNAGTVVMRKYTDLISKNPYFSVSAAEVWNTGAIASEYPDSAFPYVLTWMSAGNVPRIESVLERSGGATWRQ